MSREAAAGAGPFSNTEVPAVASRLHCFFVSFPGTCVPGYRVSSLRDLENVGKPKRGLVNSSMSLLELLLRSE